MLTELPREVPAPYQSWAELYFKAIPINDFEVMVDFNNGAISMTGTVFEGNMNFRWSKAAILERVGQERFETMFTHEELRMLKYLINRAGQEGTFLPDEARAIEQKLFYQIRTSQNIPSEIDTSREMYVLRKSKKIFR